MDESPRWLIQRKRYKEAIEILQKAFKKNKVKDSNIPRIILNPPLTKINSNKENKTLEDTQKTHWYESIKQDCATFLGMKRIVFSILPIWFLQNMQYFGIVLSANNYSK